MSILQTFFQKTFTSLLAPLFKLAFGETTPEDEAFINNSLEICNIEIEISNLALKRSTEEELKKFSKKMIIEYSNICTELSTLLNTHNFKSPAKAEFSAKENKIIFDLKSTESFNKAYARNQIHVHEEIIELFQIASTSADTGIATFAKRTLPKLQYQLKIAKGLEK